ncbi:MAG: family 78 glycoside hydrolase catalytic domain [Kiritimatiellae bacterium]|nr:family 78 glycoside hydrolase catalytic domain [Kiritimatiellia bacterium]
MKVLSPLWISGGEGRPEDAAPILERRFTLESAPARAELTLAVAGWHEVSVNGRRVGDEVLSPATCQPDLRISSVARDIAPFLKAGENVVEVLLGNGWHNCFTREVWGFCDARWLSAPMIRGELVADGETLFATDGHWTAYDSPIAFNALRNGEWHDARREGVRGNERAATVVKYTPFAVVSPDDAPPCRAFDPLPPVRSFPAAGGGVIYDFGTNRAGWCEIEVVGEAGAKVLIDYDESLSPDGDLLGLMAIFLRQGGDPRPFQHDEYTLAGRPEGERWHPRFTYHGFRYARVKVEGKAELKSIRSVFVHSDFKSVGSLTISNPVFARLNDAARRGYLSNFVGIPTDCPHREKNGWTGDAQLAMETGLWNFDAKAGYVHFLRMMLDAQRPDGAVPCILPCTDKYGYKWGTGPAWDAALFEIPWQIFRFYGDDTAAREAYPAMKKYLAFISSKAREDGLVEFGLGDWATPKTLERTAPVLLADSAYVYSFNRRLAFWAERFGEGDVAAACREGAARIKASFNAEFYKSDGIYAGGELTSLAAPLYFDGLCADGEEQKVAEALVRAVRERRHQAWFGIQGAKWVPRALAKYGFIDDAWRIFTQPESPGWACWTKDWDTLMEHLSGTPRSRAPSHNHIMFGDLSAWAFEFVAGIKIKRPGFAKFDVRPHLPEGVDSFEATYSSPAGPICVRAWREGGVAKCEITGRP